MENIPAKLGLTELIGKFLVALANVTLAASLWID